jgi:hypothetical protein
MATTKVKRSIHLAQPQPQHPRRSPNGRNPNNAPAELMPVKAHVYHAIAELNAGLEKAIQNLQTLQSNNLFRASGLAEMNHALRGIHARASWQIPAALSQRETAKHYASS